MSMMSAMKLSHFLFLEIAMIDDDCDEVVPFLIFRNRDE
jgi:hypothetical protein